MALVTGSTEIDGSNYLISVSGTELEVRAELASGASVGQAYRWGGDPARVIASGGDATACFVLYLCPKP